MSQPKKTTRKKPSRKTTASGGTKSPVRLARDVKPLVRLQLAVAAGGRCEFPACNRYLLEHHVTQNEGNFAEAAHIVAFSKEGPRGEEQRPSNAKINAFENLMFLCPICHKEIDDHPSEYPVALLQSYKADHEKRILELTEIGPEKRTTVIQLRGIIAGQHVDIPAHDVRMAIKPRYAANRRGHVIDLGGGPEGPEFFRLAQQHIRRELKTILGGGIDGNVVRRYAVFALAPIPALVAFGRELGDKVAADLFQRHRSDQSWCWRTEGTPVTYDFRVLRKGTDPSAVGLVLSLSGRVTESSLPTEVDERFSLYELTLLGQEPNREFLRLAEDLVAFRRAYQDALQRIVHDHEQLPALHLFAAVPAPVAIACGQDLMLKIHAPLVVYDNVNGRFERMMEVGGREAP